MRHASRPARVTAPRAEIHYAVVSGKRLWKREVDMSAQVVLLTIGAVGGATALSWYLVRFVTARRYQKLIKERLHALDVGERLQSACR